MRLKELLNEDMSADEIKAEIKKIRDEKAESKRRNSGVQVKPFGKHTIVGGMVIHTSDYLTISNSMVNEEGFLRVPFRSARAIEIIARRLTSFKNFPITLTGTWGHAITYEGHRDGGEKITSFEGFPQDITGNVALNAVKFTELNYSKFNTFCKRLKGGISIRPDYEGPILSLILVKDLESMRITTGRNTDTHASKLVQGIINEQLSGDRDIMEAKEQLMGHGLKEFAKL